MTACQDSDEIKTNTVDYLNKVSVQQDLNQSRSSSDLDGEDYKQEFPFGGFSDPKSDTKLLSKPKLNFLHKQQEK